MYYMYDGRKAGGTRTMWSGPLGGSRGRGCCLSPRVISHLAFAVVLLVLLGLVVFQAGYQASKYYEGKTTVARSIEYHQRLDMPAVSLCPGLKREAIKRLSWPMALYRIYPQHSCNCRNDTGGADPDGVNFTSICAAGFPSTKEAMEAAWDELNFELEEIVDRIYLQESADSEYKHFVPQNYSALVDGTALAVKRRDTFSGKCYTFTFGSPFSKEGSVEFSLDLKRTHLNELAVLIHHPDAYLGLNKNYWPSPAYAGHARANHPVDFNLRVRRLLNRTAGAAEDYFDCVLRGTRGDVEEMVANASDEACFHPSFRSMLDLSPGAEDAWPACRDIDEYVATWDLFWPVMQNLVEDGRCPRPRVEDTYSVDEKTDISGVLCDGYGSLMLYFASMAVVVEEEQVLLDLGTLVSSIGGIVGWFLGWSILDLARTLIERARTMYAEKI